MRPTAGSLPASDDPNRAVLILRDGTVASVRPSRRGDERDIARFFHDLSPESRIRRFFTSAEPSDALIAQMSDSSDPARGLTLLVHREIDGTVRPIAVASYSAAGPPVAEVAFAVDDRFQRNGLGSLLFERLAAAAAAYGFERLEAATEADNAGMLEVFRDSGFAIRSKTSAGYVELQLMLTPSQAAVQGAEERERRAVAASLRPLLAPRAVAVVGASRDPNRLGRRVLDALRRGGFNGPVHAVNPNAETIDGLRAYRSARELPDGVDLAVLAVPRDAILGVVDDCAAAGVASLVVITAGFAEAGAAGRALQHSLLDRVRQHGMRMVGPNCMGVLNAAPGVRLNASFAPYMPPGGSVALSSQSGALGLAILELAGRRAVGLSTFVSVGNKADVSGNDLLQYWESDPETSVILLYLESFGNPRHFGRIARRVGRSKPIVAIKAGRSRSGRRAAGSHTAALAASETAVTALFHQAGVIRADTIDEMFDIAACLEAQPLPEGRRVAVVTNAGGPGILAVDACESAGLEVPELPAAVQQQLRTFLPPEAGIGNPVDLIASARPEQYRRAIEVLLGAPQVDILIVIFTPIDPHSVEGVFAAIRAAVAAGRQAGAKRKPVLACLMAEPGATPLPAGDERIPTYPFPENAARAAGKVARYAAWRALPPALLWAFDDVGTSEVRDLCRGILKRRGPGWLDADEARQILDAFRIPLVAATPARSAGEAAALAAGLGFPVVAKIQGGGGLHKTDVGGVRVGLTSEREVRAAFEDLSAVAAAQAREHDVRGVAIQPMIAGGVETIIGVTEDPQFGALIAFGLGGVHVEVLQDVAFRMTPLTDRDADELLHGIRGFKLLEGFRGHPPADIEALREILLRVAQLVEEVPEIAELDLNPVIALAPGQGCRVVDARVKVGWPRRGREARSDGSSASGDAATPAREDAIS
jgi:acetyl coenzyme A synthetase (ADP forming)-like protein